jgi:glycosyltransferase involved in cell wall biosynthesis
VNVSVIIPVQNEESTISAVLKEVKKLDPFEIITVLNGSTDRTEEIAKSYGCTILSIDQALGNDIGRALGAKQATGDIFLFLDGDIAIPYNHLIPFIEAIQTGYDIAINDLSFLASQKICPHYTTVSKLAVNSYLKKSNLTLNSLLAVPHTIKREAVQKMGWEHLADPILAQAIAIKKGLKICSPCRVDVINTNKIRPIHGELDPKSIFPITTSRIIGDHLRAISYLTACNGGRADFKSKARSSILPKNPPHGLRDTQKKSKYSAIISTAKECPFIESTVNQAKLAGVEELILVAANGVKDITSNINVKKAIILELDEHSDLNSARLAGAKSATGDICLFLNGNQPIQAEEIKLFLDAVENGADVALHNRKRLLDNFNPTDSISIGQYFVNMALNRPDLFNSGLAFLPFAINKKVFETQGNDVFMIPPLAQIKLILAGFKVKSITTKKLGHYNQFLNTEEVLGDQLEALSYLIKITDERGGFTDGGRRREFLS